jgi:glycopeptide antibiotics resistance protein
MFLRLFFTYLIILLLLSVLPLNSQGSDINDLYIIRLRFDYLVHAVIFLPYMILARKAFSEKSAILPLMLTGIIYAILCEGIQYPLPYRAFNINDLLANLTGFTLSIPLSLLIKPHP